MPLECVIGRKRKKKKIMPNRLEGIKCQQAEEGKKIVCYFLMVLLLHWSFCCCCSFFLQLEKKKRFWNSSFYNIVFCPLLLTGSGRSFLKLLPKRTVFFDLIPVTPSLVLLSLPPNAPVYRLSSSGNVAASMSYPESNSAEYRSSSAADSDRALLSRIEPPLLDISSRARQKKMQAEGENIHNINQIIMREARWRWQC